MGEKLVFSYGAPALPEKRGHIGSGRLPLHTPSWVGPWPLLPRVRVSQISSKDPDGESHPSFPLLIKQILAQAWFVPVGNIWMWAPGTQSYFPSSHSP